MFYSLSNGEIMWINRILIYIEDFKIVIRMMIEQIDDRMNHFTELFCVFLQGNRKHHTLCRNFIDVFFFLSSFFREMFIQHSAHIHTHNNRSKWIVVTLHILTFLFYFYVLFALRDINSFQKDFKGEIKAIHLTISAFCPPRLFLHNLLRLLSL